MSRWSLWPEKKTHWIALLCASLLLATLGWAVLPTTRTPPPLAAMLPDGALMTVESQDFGAVVSAWNRSPEQRAWLASANYSAFTNSRLFTRLSDAQDAFAGAAKTDVNGQFLTEVAGKESIFAWYDIGNLEFLYLSHLPADRIAKLDLLAQRGSFARREAGGTAFFVRTGTATDANEAGAADQDADAGGTSGASPSQPRTVAFAVRGNWLVLGSREDLVAGALQLMADPGANAAASQANAGWYAAAAQAGPPQHGDLHMLLDLQALTKTPQFRTYWIQRNITDTRQYRAAVVDLYREQQQFREERVLLPMQASEEAAAQPDLGALEQLVPERAGVYRAVAHPDAAAALDALKTKLLAREPGAAPDTTSSPAAQTTVSPVRNSGDFETRIDAPTTATASAQDRFTELKRTLDAAGLESMLTLDRTDPPEAGQIFVPVRSAVILRAASPWNEQALASALLGSVRSQITTANLGLAWSPAGAGGGKYLSLGAAYPMCLWVEGPLAIVSSDPQLMDDMLARRTSSSARSAQAQVIAEFRHSQERAQFRRIMAELNLPQTSTSGAAEPAADTGGQSSVDLFGDNLPSLSDTFQSLASEHFLQTIAGGQVHQTVLYRWNAP